MFRFVDLFAGIGGIRMGLERAGGECVYTVEFDRFAAQTYSANFGRIGADGERLPEEERDIHNVQVSDLPAYDLLAGGFPCQSFSLAGVSKKLSLGRAHGFDDKKTGNLFFEIARLIDQAPSPPKLLFVEFTRPEDGEVHVRIVTQADFWKEAPRLVIDLSGPARWFVGDLPVR